MATPLFFSIPRDSLITLPKHIKLCPAADVHVAYADVRAWAYSVQARGLVVVIDLTTVGLASEVVERASIVAFDGPWVQQLIKVTSSADGGP
jgi:hypothetical protein